MIEFDTIKIDDKYTYENYLFGGKEHGCEFSFANVYSWGHQTMAVLHNHIVLLTNFHGQYFYPFPIGQGDKKAVLDALLADAQERCISFQMSGLSKEDKHTLEELYPGMFCFSFDRNSFDYVYSINDLADLKGRKYHRKRNHLKRFQNAHPNYQVVPLNDNLLPFAKQMVAKWYESKHLEHPEDDYVLEQSALERALYNYKELSLEGLLLINEGEVLAFTLGSRISIDTFDVHFEKARADVEGAYTAINFEFARYIRDNHPDIRFLNREEDMGIPGLRKAKESYFPHHQIEKYRAYLLEDLSIGTPDESQHANLRVLWKEAFGDEEQFLNLFFTTAFSPMRCRIATLGNRLAAALYWFDCLYEDKPIAYLYAVATAKAFQGQGLARKLILDTHTHLTLLGYAGSILVPNGKELFAFYKKLGYQICSYVNEFEIEHATTNIKVNDSNNSDAAGQSPEVSLRTINIKEYATLRRQFLPERSVIQENENLHFLKTQAKFYAGKDFVMAGYIEKTGSAKEHSSPETEAISSGKILHGIELLGNVSCAPEITHGFNCSKGKFRTPGEDIPFAMYHPLADNTLPPPFYFGLAFD